MRIRSIGFLLTITICASLARVTFAQTAAKEFGTADLTVLEPKPEAKPVGWHWRLTLGASISHTNNHNWVGQPTGNTFTFGFKGETAAEYFRRKHEWRSTLGISEAFTRTPLIDEFIKSADAFTLESIYLYHWIPWAGPFARFQLQTALFSGRDLRPAPVTYNVAELDGTIDTFIASELALTDKFRPFTLKESVGPFAQPIRKPEINVELRLGFGARQTFADDQLAVTDDAATPEIEVTRLQDVHQAGAEFVGQGWGTLEDNRVTYKLTVEAMMPFIKSELPPGDDRGAAELTNVDVIATISFKLVKWASLDYEFKAVRQPQLLDLWQLQSNLLLTFSYTAERP